MTTLKVVPYGADLWLRIAPYWTSLLDRRSDASAFVSAPWISTWIRVFGARLKPEALLWTDERGECIGACLLTIRHEKRGPFTVRRAYLNATGENLLASEHNMLLCVPGAEAQLSAALVAHVRRRRADSLVLSGFRVASADAIRDAWPASGASDGFSSDDLFVTLADLRDAKAEYLSVLSRNTREKIRRSIRLYEETSGSLVLDTAVTPEQALRAFADLRELHDARWRARGLPGAFATDEVARFHELLIQEYATKPAASGDFSIEIVRILSGDVLVGALYNLVYRGRISFYQSGFHYSEDNRLKPGLVTHALAIQGYLAGDATEYDFLAGESEAARYKESLGTGRRHLVWLEWSLPNTKMRIINRLRAWNAARRSPVVDAPAQAD